MDQENQIAKPNPFELRTFDDALNMAKQIAGSGCFGIKKPEQAMTLMMLANSEGQTLAEALKRYHVFDNGQLSQRADWTIAKFMQTGSIIWHARSDEMCAATFSTVKLDAEGIKRAKKRFAFQYELQRILLASPDDRADNRDRELELIGELSELAIEGEVTVVHTRYGMDQRGITTNGKGETKSNWIINPTNMLQWRVATDAIKLIDPGAYAGLSSDSDLQDVAALADSRPQSFTPVERKDRDRAAMEALLSQHENELANTTDKQRGQTLMGLISDLRCQIADLDVEPRNKLTAEPPVARTLSPMQKVTEGSFKADDNIPMTHATDPVVEPEPIDPDNFDWRDYRLSQLGNTKHQGKKLGDLDIKVLATLWEKRGTPKLEDPNPLIVTEAKFIIAAYENTLADKKK